MHPDPHSVPFTGAVTAEDVGRRWSDGGEGSRGSREGPCGVGHLSSRGPLPLPHACVDASWASHTAETASGLHAAPAGLREVPSRKRPPEPWGTSRPGMLVRAEPVRALCLHSPPPEVKVKDKGDSACSGSTYHTVGTSSLPSQTQAKPRPAGSNTLCKGHPGDLSPGNNLQGLGHLATGLGPGLCPFMSNEKDVLLSTCSWSSHVLVTRAVSPPSGGHPD